MTDKEIILMIKNIFNSLVSKINNNKTTNDRTKKRYKKDNQIVKKKICIKRDCELERFENEDECILHCDKTINNKWILCERIEKNKNNYPVNRNHEWDEGKIDKFWNVLFKEIKNVIIKRTKKELNHVTTNNAVRLLGENRKTGFKLNFLGIKFPPSNKILNNFISKNNKIIIDNTFQNCIFLDNYIFNYEDIVRKDNKEIINKNIPCKFFNCTFEKNLIYFTCYSQNKGLFLYDCTIKKNIEINSSFKNIEINNTNAKLLKIETFPIKKLKINKIKIQSSKIAKILLKNYKINELVIDDLESKSIYFANNQFNTFTIKNIKSCFFNLIKNTTKKDATLIFENIKTKSLKIIDFFQESKYTKFNNIEVTKKFLSKKVDYKNIYFNYFDIEKANKKILLSFFTNSHLSLIKWGDISKIISTKDIFRNLKFINDEQGNFLDANKFYQMEMLSYKNELKKRNEHLFYNFQDKMIFFFAEKISNFGQSWFLALEWLIIVNLGFYFIAKTQFDFLSFCYSLLSFLILFIVGLFFQEIKDKSRSELICLFIIIYLIFLIYSNSLGSLHNFSEFISIKIPENKEFNFYDSFHLWYLNKIVSAFILYYFIIALRINTKR